MKSLNYLKESLNEYDTTEKKHSKKNKLLLIFITLSIISMLVLFSFAVSFTSKEKKDIIKKDYSAKSNEKNVKWAPAGNKIKTRWGMNLDPEKIWQEYPRPQLERKEWMNLNGLWKYALRKKVDLSPDEYDGEILVPFPVESSLSGVMKSLTQDDALWYYKEIEIPQEWSGKHILLNFGGVDWQCEVYINRKKVGEHTGGYSSFYFDITSFLNTGKNKLLIKVIDYTDTVHSEWGKFQPVGKQTLTPNGIWYTPTSGIWQTVWLEPVNEYHFEKLEINNDFYSKQLKITFDVLKDAKLSVELTVKFEDKIIKQTKGTSNEEITIQLSDSNFKPWSPDEPNLYTIEANLLSDSGNIIDSIYSYTAIRVVESRKDSNNILRIFFNNKPLFNIGPLDQGFWPDGLYTPPSEEAMIYDIQKLKDLGFNTIRKHIKTECDRYYYYCDKIGMLVWQDMPAGNIDDSGAWDNSRMDGGRDNKRTEKSKNTYYKEWGEIIDNLKFFQSIIIWVPFNEAMGQFDTEAVVNFTLAHDDSRLINAASGGNHRQCSHFVDIHSYPGPNYFFKYESLINVIGEYGGLALEIKGHTWKDDNWGYEVLKDKIAVTNRYIEFINALINLVPQGISAGIYTQTTDVEGEINGLMTYDRNETKVYDVVKEYHQKIINSLTG